MPALDDIARYPWPDLAHPSRFAGLKDEARAIQQAGYAVVALSGVSPFEYCYMLRGMERWFTDLAQTRNLHRLYCARSPSFSRRLPPGCWKKSASTSTWS